MRRNQKFQSPAIHTYVRPEVLARSAMAARKRRPPATLRRKRRGQLKQRLTLESYSTTTVRETHAVGSSLGGDPLDPHGAVGDRLHRCRRIPVLAAGTQRDVTRCAPHGSLWLRVSACQRSAACRR